MALYAFVIKKMITKEEAQKIIYNKINEIDHSSSDMPEMVIVEDSTIEKEYGWIFFYESKDFLESGKTRDAIAGNSPYIFNKYTAEIVETGAAHTIEYYIKEYERNFSV